jgi:hypothetical protein
MPPRYLLLRELLPARALAPPRLLSFPASRCPLAAERLPEDCRPILSLNAIKWVADYRDASFKKLIAALQLR